MDGTLIDTEPLWGQATYELGELLGRPLTPEVRERTVGGSFDNTLRIVAAWAGRELSLDDAHLYKTWMFSRMRELFAGGIELNPGVEGVLASLAARGMPMLVTTNTERSLADPCIDAIGREFFVDTITGNEVGRPKPAPDMYLEAARRVGAAPGECLVFEDSWSGMSAAAGAGCRVLGLSESVPEGVSVFDPARFVGAGAADVDEWFAELVG
ncbi:HAD family phosphatase [Corynebacterium sp. CNCTC7651]|nr:HAD family phosphatase [Corynebacterium sp. CNCTC7651]UIZ93345.1 HAD family phosphatase [Corynebacterium sp. CNCTC7651]